jgi:alpha-tubulin suppressor-like RCC1 family protein
MERIASTRCGIRRGLILAMAAGAAPAIAQVNGPVMQLGAPGATPQVPYPWFIQVDPGYDHNLALRLDGTLVGWGENLYGQTGVYPDEDPGDPFVAPPGTSAPGQATTQKFKQVSAGWRHSVGIISDPSDPNRDGTAVGWGFNFVHQAEVPWPTYKWQVVWAGENFSAGLIDEPVMLRGHLRVWGVPCFQEGRPGDASSTADDWPRLDGMPYKSLSVNGGHHGLLLDANSVLYGFGYNYWREAYPEGIYRCNGALEHPALPVDYKPAPSPMPTLKSVAAGHYHSVALTSSDEVICWGWNPSFFFHCIVPAAINDINGPYRGHIVELTSGHHSSMAILDDGRVLAWGGGLGSGVLAVLNPNHPAASWVGDHEEYLGIESRNPGSRCYANCDGSSVVPFLNVLDFSCFLNLYSSGSTWANCDGSTTIPLLTVGDMGCFMNLFAAGCTNH